MTAIAWKLEWKKLAWMAAVFALCFWMPLGAARFDHAIVEALHLAKWYAREHVLLCLVPALFIAGAIAAFVNQGAVIRYLGPQANKVLAYGVASVSGAVLAVCSCTVLPLFAGIYRMGAGIGPAAAFLYTLMTIDSAWRHLRGRGGGWKNRTYARQKGASQKGPAQHSPAE